MKLTAGSLIALLLPALASAQNWNASLSYGPGGLVSRYGTGVAYYGGFSVERIFAGRVGIGVDIGGVNASPTNFNYSAGLLAFGGSYHFIPAARRVDPFVTAGIAGVTLEGAPALIQFGAGMNYWVKKNFALRAEIRDQVGNDGGTALHYLATRFGIAFRW